MLLQFRNGTPFAGGAQAYEYRPATTAETYERIIARVRVGGIQTAAIVDTGGVFFVCTPEISAGLGLEPKYSTPTDRLILRGRTVSGSLYPVEIELIADEGENLSLLVATFVPYLKPNEEWLEEFPCILGLHGCLERIRFAIDPEREKIYFGSAV